MKCQDGRLLSRFFWFSLGISVVVLLAAGFYKAKMTIGSPVKSALQMAVIGMSAALAGYFIGKIFSQNCPLNGHYFCILSFFCAKVKSKI